MFAHVARDDVSPDYVVVGDMGEGFTYAVLDRAFALLERGARLVALQRNMAWHDGTRRRLDCGAFVAALEAAAGQEALVMGKPSPHCFRLALDALGTAPEQTVMVGDDVDTDIAGATAAGLRSVLVGTGAFHPDHLLPPHPRPTRHTGSVADLPHLLGA
jgi:inorganic pyrophosphatase